MLSWNFGTPYSQLLLFLGRVKKLKTVSSKDLMVKSAIHS